MLRGILCIHLSMYMCIYLCNAVTFVQYFKIFRIEDICNIWNVPNIDDDVGPSLLVK